VRERDERGCDVVKIMVTGGSLTPTFPMWRSQFSLDEVRAVVDAAHAAGLPVAAHCHGVDGIEQALAAGVDSIEHCTFFVEGDRAVIDEDLMARLAASGIAISSTMGRLPGQAITTAVIAANMEAMMASRGRLHALGANMVVGTDAGIGPIKPHDVLPHAFSDLVAIGMSHLEALRALTSNAAATCHVGGRKGRLKAGWDADLLAVEGDATSDTAALLAPVAVWHDGRRVR
jgi:imidazolonepropionase-like amidohydrolase